MKSKLQSILILSFTLFVLSSCQKDSSKPGRIFTPDMTYSQAYETYSPNPNFENGLTARNPIAGTISYGTLPPFSETYNNEANHISFLHKYYFLNTNEGYESAGQKLKNPLPLTKENIAKGKALYTIHCIVCHGEKGEGNGVLVERGKYPAVPKYYDRLPTINDGKIFHSITWGKNLMGGYGSQVSPEERWLLVYYIQQLGEAGPFLDGDPFEENEE